MPSLHTSLSSCSSLVVWSHIESAGVIMDWLFGVLEYYHIILGKFWMMMIGKFRQTVHICWRRCSFWDWGFAQLDVESFLLREKIYICKTSATSAKSCSAHYTWWHISFLVHVPVSFKCDDIFVQKNFFICLSSIYWELSIGVANHLKAGLPNKVGEFIIFHDYDWTRTNRSMTFDLGEDFPVSYGMSGCGSPLVHSNICSLLSFELLCTAILHSKV